MTATITRIGPKPRIRVPYRKVAEVVYLEPPDAREVLALGYGALSWWGTVPTAMFPTAPRSAYDAAPPTGDRE